MDQHRLYNTLKSLSDQKFTTDEQLLSTALDLIVRKEELPIRGGRIWKLDPGSGSYRLLRQMGDMEPIDKNFRIKAVEYPLFLQLFQLSQGVFQALLLLAAGLVPIGSCDAAEVGETSKNSVAFVIGESLVEFAGPEGCRAAEPPSRCRRQI